MRSLLSKSSTSLRERVGAPIIVTSGYRCPVHNANVNGVPNSQHVLGTVCRYYLRCSQRKMSLLIWQQRLALTASAVTMMTALYMWTA